MKQLECAGINYEVVEAVDGSKISRIEIGKYNKNRKRFFKEFHHPWVNYFSLDGLLRALRRRKNIFRLVEDMAVGEIGCSLSHLKVYEKIIKRGSSWNIILEDDAQLLVDPSDLFNYISELAQKWDVIYLGYNHIGFRSFIDKRGIPLRVKGKKHLSMNLTLGRLIAYPFGSHAYAISLAGAKLLLSKAEPLRCQADLLLGGGYEFPSSIAAFSPRIIGLHSSVHMISTISAEIPQKHESNWKIYFRCNFNHLYILTKKVYYFVGSCFLLLRQLFAV